MLSRGPAHVQKVNIRATDSFVVSCGSAAASFVVLQAERLRALDHDWIVLILEDHHLRIERTHTVNVVPTHAARAATFQIKPADSFSGCCWVDGAYAIFNELETEVTIATAPDHKERVRVRERT